ncbi:hypothetical protein HMPREF1860_01646 [Prevotella amnii]|uniref:Uncharacterized protein n=1 Tax=Prevotella amnii TaxID=419005 RepID=A0A134B8K7_9BACT|nr:hypothetical protein HMPREF1860_01646 [Prevotella amnii]
MSFQDTNAQQRYKIISLFQTIGNLFGVFRFYHIHHILTYKYYITIC